MNWITRIRSILFLGSLSVAPLIRLNPEQHSPTRGTWIWLILIAICCVLNIFLQNKQLQYKYVIPILILEFLILLSAIIGTYPANIIGVLFYFIAILFVYTGFATITTGNSKYFLATLLCISGLYAQWGIFQFILQHDMYLQPIGESIINTHTSGVATFTSHGNKYIRAYGPFAHANSLSGVLLLGCISVLTLLKQSARKNTVKDSMFINSILFLLMFGLATTFSRSALISAVALILYFTYSFKKKTLFLLALIPVLLISPLLIGRTTDARDVAIHDRLKGLSWAVHMETIPSYIRGYGVGNYTKQLKNYLDSNSTHYNTWDLTPIHSSPLYIFTQLGIVISVGILVAVYKYAWNKKLLLLTFLLPTILLDHYFASQLGPLIWLASCVILFRSV